MSRWRLLGAGLAAAVVAVAVSLFGFTPVNAALAAGAAAAMVMLVGGEETGVTMAWPQLARPVRGGHRHEVSRLSWSLTGPDGRLTSLGLHQLRDVARGRLALAGIDLDDDDAVRSRLGERALGVLRATPTAPPTLRALDHCLSALEDLDLRNSP